MDKETFCDKYCPDSRHVIYTPVPPTQDTPYADCDLEETTECPFRCVNFSEVQEGETRVGKDKRSNADKPTNLPPS